MMKQQNLHLHFTLLVLALFPFTVCGQSQITGKVTDRQTGEPLSFATLGFVSVNLGTVTEKDGTFKLSFPENLKTDTLVISYMGYEDFKLVPGEQNSFSISLEVSSFRFEEVVVTPITAAEYMKKVIRAIPDNYLDVPFRTISYYKEYIDEREVPIKYTEAGFVSYQHPFASDSANQHQLVLHRELAEQEMQFMREKMLKKQAKKKAKALKRGKSPEEEEVENVVVISMGGPENVLNDDPVRYGNEYLDSLQFKNYRFSYGDQTVYNGSPVQVIEATTRGFDDGIKTTASIYIDRNTLSVIKIDEHGRFRVPLALRPLLFAFGYSIQPGELNTSIKYRSFNGRWYPENFTRTVSFGITKHNMFSKNEHSDFDVEQIFSIRQITTDAVAQIEKTRRFDKDKEIEEQIHNPENIGWEMLKQ